MYNIPIPRRVYLHILVSSIFDKRIRMSGRRTRTIDFAVNTLRRHTYLTLYQKRGTVERLPHPDGGLTTTTMGSRRAVSPENPFER